MNISMRAIGICAVTAVLAGCGGNVPGVPASTTSQAQTIGGRSRAFEQPAAAVFKITIDNSTGWQIVARGYRHSCIEDLNPPGDQRIASGSAATFTIRTGDVSKCLLGIDHLAYASLDLLLYDPQGKSYPQQTINLMEFPDAAELEVWQGDYPFGGVACVHPTFWESGWHAIKPNEDVRLTWRLC